MLRKLSVVSDISISLENVRTLAILGDNGVGKTAFIEKIALVDEKNLGTVVNARGNVKYTNFSVTIDDDKVECQEVRGERYRVAQFIPSESYTYICKGHVKYKVMVVYPYTFVTTLHDRYYDSPIKPSDEDVKFSTEIKDFIDGTIIRSSIDFLYQKDDFVTYLDDLGKGISRAVKLMWMVYRYKPDILLIDDIETLMLHPLRFKVFLKWLVSRDLKAILFTTNSDSYVTLAETDKSSKFLLLRKGGHILMDRDEALDRIDYEDLRFTSLKGNTE